MKMLTCAAVTVAAEASVPTAGAFVPVYLQPSCWTNGADQLLWNTSQIASISLLEILFNH